MNRGMLQSSPVQQMMANPEWWSTNSAMRPPTPQSTATIHPFMPNTTTNYSNLLFPHQFTPTSSSSSSSSSLTFPANCYDVYQLEQFPESWSQLVLGGYGGHGEVEKIGSNSIVNGMANHLDHHHHHQAEANHKRLQNWEEQQVLDKHSPNCSSTIVDHIKQEKSYLYGGHANSEDYSFQGTKSGTTWSPKSSSCITTFTTNNVLDFSNVNKTLNHPPPDRSSECNSNANSGSAQKKARLQSSSAQSTFKVRKEKLGDRITALHQLVSPFGKTDTASVLLEAIGYIRFLQSQIEALSLPYLGGGNSGNNMRHQHSVQGERNCVFPDDPGQLLNDNCIKRKGASQQDSHEEPKKDLRSRGLCLVPISCTLQVGSENGADYWASAALGGGFR